VREVTGNGGKCWLLSRGKLTFAFLKDRTERGREREREREMKRKKERA
jgi:hypothetical protein